MRHPLWTPVVICTDAVCDCKAASKHGTIHDACWLHRFLWVPECQTLSAKQHAIPSTLISNLAVNIQHALSQPGPLENSDGLAAGWQLHPA